MAAPAGGYGPECGLADCRLCMLKPACSALDIIILHANRYIQTRDRCSYCLSGHGDPMKGQLDKVLLKDDCEDEFDIQEGWQVCV